MTLSLRCRLRGTSGLSAIRAARRSLVRTSHVWRSTIRGGLASGYRTQTECSQAAYNEDLANHLSSFQLTTRRNETPIIYTRMAARKVFAVGREIRQTAVCHCNPLNSRTFQADLTQGRVVPISFPATSAMTQIDLKSTENARLARHAGGHEPDVVAGQWALVKLAAEGSFARIYRARPTHLPADGPADYAVKLPQPRWQSDRWAIGQLAREAVVGRSVSHPNLISVLAASLGVEPRFLVMPWLEGRTLQSQLDAAQTPDLPVSLWIARQVAEALDALHRAGWMHGDVKPGNIFVSPTGHVTLLDLGFARRGNETGSAVDRRIIGGTCSHIAPEFITSTVRADIRSDIYSLGVVLFELFSGRLPFEGKNMAELVTHHKRSSPPGLRRLASHLPAEVVKLVHQMLAKEPLRRPQTPWELVERLTALEVATFSERLF